VWIEEGDMCQVVQCTFSIELPGFFTIVRVLFLLVVAPDCSSSGSCPHYWFYACSPSAALSCTCGLMITPLYLFCFNLLRLFVRVLHLKPRSSSEVLRDRLLSAYFTEPLAGEMNFAGLYPLAPCLP
jgi:hypothetical protein